jgi:NADP-dependent 3-hydroxy acid dehydrogenase YdfG
MVVLGPRGLDRLEALARGIAVVEGQVACARADVRRREDLTSFVNMACYRYGQLDFS